jgi:hypothetical protein
MYSMTLQLLLSEFPYILGQFDFLFLSVHAHSVRLLKKLTLIRFEIAASPLELLTDFLSKIID